MAEKLQAPRGTFDVLPDDGARRLALQRLADEVLADYGPIETPVFESAELFERGVGETTDIVLRQNVEGALRRLEAQRASSARNGLLARSAPSVVIPMWPG